MKRNSLRTIRLTILLSLLNVNFVYAGQEKRISFAKGKTTAVVSGKLKKGGETQYVFRARKGQRVVIKLKADDNDNDTYFSLSYGDGIEAFFLDYKGSTFSPEGTGYTQEDVETVEWDGTLPESAENDYYIRVISKKRAVGYKLQVSLK